MRTKTLRELQQKGEKAIGDNRPLLLVNRKGPVGVLIPVTIESLASLQAETEKWMALESLRKTWSLAKEQGLDRLSLKDIDKEVKQVRKKRIKRK